MHEPGFDRSRRYVEGNGYFRHAQVFHIKQGQCRTLWRGQCLYRSEHRGQISSVFVTFEVWIQRLGIKQELDAKP